MEILAIIPARSGSKTIPDKNIRLVSGKPLLAHSIEHALVSKLIKRTIVSTDSPDYAEIARRHGAEVPFLRPADISQDTSTDLETFTHALGWLREKEDYIPDICVHLRPTYPIRKVGDIDRVIQILMNDPSIDSVRSVAPVKETPFKMWFRGEEGLLSPAVEKDINDPYNLPRQVLPQAYLQNACIDAVRTSVITEMKSMTGSRIFGYVMAENLDIDDELQLREAEAQLTKDIAANKEGENITLDLDEKKTFCFDIDGIIATIVVGNKYGLAEPMQENISMVNTLYEKGHRIILFTARGSLTGIDWVEVTRNQLNTWGLKYHELVFGKPAADYYVDDRHLSIKILQTLVSGSHSISPRRRRQEQ